MHMYSIETLHSMDIFNSQYTKVLVLAAIAATSAFVVTILIVLVCVGCQRKGKRKYGQTSVGNHKRDMSVLRQSKLNSMSKSDSRLHELHRLPCKANGTPRNRPASMDLLLLHNHSMTTDPRPLTSGRQVPKIPTGPEDEGDEHIFLEEDGLYENVGLRGAPPPAPHANLAQGPATTESNPGEEVEVGSMGRNKEGQDDVTAEYASVRKVRKLERGRREEETEEENASESFTSTIHRKAVEPFHRPNFPKDVVIMGNGEQYIWKPPEESDIQLSRGPSLENGQSSASTTEVSEMYATICKTIKKKPQGFEQQNNENTLLADKEGSRGPMPQTQGKAIYEAGESWPKALDSDPPYATINPQRKREKQFSNTLKSKKKTCGQPQGPERAMTCENFYETIGDVKQAATSTTTIFTFNDGMEMYVTGL